MRTTPQRCEQSTTSLKNDDPAGSSFPFADVASDFDALTNAAGQTSGSCRRACAGVQIDQHTPRFDASTSSGPQVREHDPCAIGRTTSLSRPVSANRRGRGQKVLRGGWPRTATRRGRPTLVTRRWKAPGVSSRQKYISLSPDANTPLFISYAISPAIVFVLSVIKFKKNFSSV